MPVVKISRIARANFLHKTADPIWLQLAQKQMDVIWHKNKC